MSLEGTSEEFTRSSLRVLAERMSAAVTKDEQEELRRQVEAVLLSPELCPIPLEEICEILGLPVEFTYVRRKLGAIVRLNMEALTAYFAERLPKQEEGVDVEELDEIFLPPDSGEILTGDGTKEFKEMKVEPRFLLTLKALKELGIDLKSVWFWQGKNSKNMMRKLSYRVISVPSLNKTIFVCDEEGNRTFVVEGAQNPRQLWSMKKSELDELVKVNKARAFRWTHPGEWMVQLKTALQEEFSKTPQQRPAHLVGRDGIVEVDGRQMVCLKPYCDANGFPYNFLRYQLQQNDVRELDGIVLNTMKKHGILDAREHRAYLKEEVDAHLPVYMNEHGVGTLEGREVVDMVVWPEVVKIPGLSKKTAMKKYIERKDLDCVPKRKGLFLNPEGEGRNAYIERDIFWKDEVEATLPQQTDDNGCVVISTKEGPRIAVSVRKYGLHRGVGNFTLLLRIRDKGLVPVPNAGVRTGKAPVEVYWKDEVDPLLHAPELNEDGTIEIEGVWYVGLNAYAKHRSHTPADLHRWAKEVGITPVEGLQASSGVHTIELYLKDPIDAISKAKKRMSET